MFAFLAAILIAIAVILFLPLKAEFNFKDREICLKICISGIRVFRRVFGKKVESKSKSEALPLERTAEIEKGAVSFEKKLSLFKEVYRTAVKFLRKYVELNRLDLRIDLGVDDAALTAVTVGALWGIIYSLIGALGSVIYINKHNVQINPVYANSVFYLDGKCIFRSRLVYIIIIAITILIKKQSRKGKEE